MRSSILFLSVLLLLASCGNPHVVAKKLNDRVKLPSIATPLEVTVKSPEVSSDDESGTISIVTKRPEEKKEIQVANPNTDSDLILSYKVELGLHFRLELGDCLDLIKSTELCSPKIVFSSSAPGVYTDNLIISYRSILKPELSKNAIIPLRGERLVDDFLPVNIKSLLLSGADGASAIILSTKDTSTKEPLRAQNPNVSSDLSVSYSLGSGEFFKLDKNDCKEVLIKNSFCSPILLFSATEPGVYKDNVIATYSSISHPELSKSVLLPVSAEKLPVILPVNPLITPSVQTSEGKDKVSLSTFNSEAKEGLVVTNKDDNDDLDISYAIERGHNFKLSMGDCGSVLESLNVCRPVIYFSAEKPGEYKDNLIVTYASKLRPEDQRKLVLPLLGNKQAIIPTDISLDIIPNLGANGIDFGKSFVGQSISQMVKIENASKNDIALLLKKTSDAAFTVGKSGSCKKNIAAMSTCTLEIHFSSHVVGLKNEELTLTYASIYGGSSKTVSANLIGEKIKDLNDCHGKDCNEPMKPGKLELASINGESLDFGKIGVNSTAKQTVPLLNTGDLGVNIESILIDGEGFSLGHNCPLLLLPGSCSLQVGFNPLKAGSYSGVVIVKSKDGQIVKIKIAGSAVADAACTKTSIHYVSGQPTYDFKKVVLPYLNSAKNTSATISNLYGTKVNSYVKSINRYTVKDAQVLTTFIIPALKGKIEVVEFNLDAAKVVLDGYSDTESVCLSSKSIQKCSGKDFVASSFYALKNPKFWDKFTKPMSDLYETSLLEGKYKCGDYVCTNMKKTFSGNKLFDLTEEELASVLNDGVLNLIVTDDTRNLVLPSLKISTSEIVECKN